MKLIPTAGRIVVKKDASAETQTETGIILQREEVESEEILKVVVAEGDKIFSTGLTVYVSKYSAMPIKDNTTGEELFIVPTSDVLAVETEE